MCPWLAPSPDREARSSLPACPRRRSRTRAARSGGARAVRMRDFPASQVPLSRRRWSFLWLAYGAWRVLRGLGSLQPFLDRTEVQSGVLGGEDFRPIVLHADDVEAELTGAVERLGERAQAKVAVIGEFALAIVMMQQERHARPKPRHRVAHHRHVAVGIAEGQDRVASDVKPDVFHLRVAVVETAEFGELHQLAAPVGDLEAR